MNRYPRRLIEVDLPIKRISTHARREKSIRHGHISTLHIYWARRPLAACRAVILASLWPDPAPGPDDPRCPPAFLAAARTWMATWATKHAEKASRESFSRLKAIQDNPAILVDEPLQLRDALLDFIADFANWDNSTDTDYLETSRALVQAAHEALGGALGTRPLVVDPFAGGGAIPLEALRVGADAFASDLNPVAVLLNKVVLEYIPTYGQRLADEVRRWGAWINQDVKKELGEYYPKDPDGATPVAYLWARTVLSEAPGRADAPVEVPLLRSMWLSRRREFQWALRWARDRKGAVKVENAEIELDGRRLQVLRPALEIFAPTTPDDVEEGTVKGGAATCPLDGFTTRATRVREQLQRQRGGADYSRLYAAYVERPNGRREFRIAGPADVKVFQTAKARAAEIVASDPEAFPTEHINPVRPYKDTRGLSAVTRIGCASFGDLYNRRQALSIRALYNSVSAVGLRNVTSDQGLAQAVLTILAFAVNRSVSQNTSVSRWDASRLTIKGAFSKQALAVVWDFAEANPFSGGSADWDGAVEWVVKFIDANRGIQRSGTAVRASARELGLPSDSVAALVTDPPYFAAIPYGDLSDFFYVWLRRGLRPLYPDLLGSELTDKSEELIVTNAQRGSKGQVKDDLFFRKGMAAVLESARDFVQPAGVGVVVYAEGTIAGWEAILGAIIDSGWIVTSSWPIDTEMANRTQAQGSASLQSSVHIVCRPREDPDGALRIDEVGEWRDVLAELPRRIHDWMPRLVAEGVVGADAIWACLGPALEVFSRYSRVEKASGETVSLGEYLEQVWAVVSTEALSMIFDDADAAGLEPDARLTAMWLWTLGASNAPSEQSTSDEEDDDDAEEGDGKRKPAVKGFTLEFDAARKIAQGLGIHLDRSPSIVQVKGNMARLLPVAERKPYLFGRELADGSAAVRPRRAKQQKLFAELESAEATATGSGLGSGLTARPKPGQTVLDRVHQAMVLFAVSRGEALKQFLVDDGVGRDARFWKLAQSLSALYPGACEEKRWVDGVLARKKGLGF